MDTKHSLKQWLCFIIFFCLNSKVLCGYQDEENLYTKLFTGYNAIIPPSPDKGPVVVAFDVKLKSLNNLSPKKQVLTVDTFVIMQWSDPRLTWNKTDYNNVSTLKIPSSSIWAPDIMLYNRADSAVPTLYTDLYTTKLLVFNTGKVIWRNLVTLHASCQVDMTWFPVDKQTCEMSFGSWSYSIMSLKMKFLKQPSKDDVKNIKSDKFSIDSGEWTINEFDSSSSEQQFSCCPEAFSSISYTLIISRVSLYYFIYILLPLISLSFMFLLIFHIPADSGERMGFGVTILLSITVYLLVISEKLPEKSDETPMLGINFITIFYVLVFALFLAGVTTVLSRRTNRPPDWLVKLTKYGCFKQKDQEPVSKVRPVSSRKFRQATNGQAVKEVDVVDQNENQESLFEPEEDFSKDWAKICRIIDKKLFVMFAVILVLIPIVIVISLPTSGKGV